MEEDTEIAFPTEPHMTSGLELAPVLQQDLPDNLFFPNQNRRALALARWRMLIERALAERLDADAFRDDCQILREESPLSGIAVADLLLRTRSTQCRDVPDPRVLGYAQVLLDEGIVDTLAVLRGLYKYSASREIVEKAKIHAEALGGRDDGEDTKKTNGEPVKKQEAPMRWTNSYGMEEYLFYRLTKSSIKAKEVLNVVLALARWAALFTNVAIAVASDMTGGLLGPASTEEIESARTAFVMLLLTTCEASEVQARLKRREAADTRRLISEALLGFIPSIMTSAPEAAARLEGLRSQTLPSFEAPAAKKVNGTDMDDLLDAAVSRDSVVIPDMPIVNSRAGLYVYLNAALVARPVLDDLQLLNYLNNRYQGDMQAAAIDLILASFDILANGISKNKGPKSAHLLRSFLVNKVPLILASFVPMASLLFPFDPAFCIPQALAQVDTGTFPTISSLFDNNNSNPVTESVRQDFCYACCLHGLIAESVIEQLIGDLTYQSLPAGGRYMKDVLVQQCLTDHDRTLALVNELDNMDGNVGAVCQTLTQMIGHLCADKVTMSLKTLCTHLARKPLALDVMLLFDKATTILRPLCELLDEWHYDEDQGEYQPVYEEFGSVLLLLLVFVNRYALTATDLGISKPDSFVAKLISKSHRSRQTEELDEQEKTALDGWIRGLFDSEAGGLSDELMSSCPPQRFYLLVPTLFHNIALALGAGYLNADLLKSGLEFFHEVFLLPALIFAITCLCGALWTNRAQESAAVLKILQSLLQPKQVSNDAAQMLTAVLNTVASTLEDAFRGHQKRNPKNLEVDPLLKVIKENIPLSRRTAISSANELEGWTSATHGGLTAVIRHTMQGLIQWAGNPGLNVMPAVYTHRQILFGLQLLTAKRLVQAIVEETRQHAGIDSAGVACDVAIAILCAPDVLNDSPGLARTSLLEEATSPAARQSPRGTLRQALRWQAEDWKQIEKTDPLLAETTLRLHRRVETQMVMNITAQPQPILGGPTSTIDTAVAAAALDSALADAVTNVAAGATGDLSGMSADPLSIDTTGLGLDLGVGSAGGAGDLGLSATGSLATGMDLGGDTDDIFSGLGNLDGWDGMDLS